MDIRRLKLLLELSRLGSMRAVADELGYTTSTVSQQLGVLAQEAGARTTRPSERVGGLMIRAQRRKRRRRTRALVTNRLLSRGSRRGFGAYRMQFRVRRPSRTGDRHSALAHRR